MKRRMWTVAVVALMATTALPAVAAAATPITGRQGTVAASFVYVRSGPGTTYQQTGRLTQGTSVYIACQRRGTRLSGPRARDWPWWNYLSRPVKGWVSDAYINSGPDERAAPDCQGTPPTDTSVPQPPPPAQPGPAHPHNCRIDTTQYPPRSFCDAAPQQASTVCAHRQNGDPGSGWGGYKPGRIPSGALVRLSDTGRPSRTAGRKPTNFRLRCDAAAAFQKLEQAFEAALRRPLELTIGYRTYAEQADCYRRKPGTCAPPGRKGAHAFAMGVDFASDINQSKSRTHRWMAQNAWRHGWCHPRWARPGGDNPEAWHWEYWGEGYMAARRGRC